MQYGNIQKSCGSITAQIPEVPEQGHTLCNRDSYAFGERVSDILPGLVETEFLAVGLHEFWNFPLQAEFYQPHRAINSGRSSSSPS
jgi:hypothetical protein